MKHNPLFILSLFLLPTLGCQEKISPELKEGANSGNSANNLANSKNEVESPFYFRLVNKADPLLGQRLHKTGPGNWNTKCSVDSATPLTNSGYRKGGVRDISCFLESEELALFEDGLKLEIQASANTCDYFIYSPFSYFNRMPGESKTTYHKVSCSKDLTPEESLAQINTKDALKWGTNANNKTNYADCDEYVNSDIPEMDRTAFKIKNEAELCRFNYTDLGKEKCDIGKITIINYSVTKVTTKDSTGKDVIRPEITQEAPREIDCGGKVLNCVDGPLIIDGGTISAASMVNVTKVPNGKDFRWTKTYPGIITLPKYKDGWGTYVYANFRRDLANKYIIYPTRTIYQRGSIADYFKNLNDEFQNYIDKFNDEDEIATYDPNVMENYSKNLGLDGQILNITNEDYKKYLYEDKKFYRKPLAADAYLSYGLWTRTQPFYTFECQDAAREPKARIRLAVRDWDRIFNVKYDDNDNLIENEELQFLENITDIFQVNEDSFFSYARMDYLETPSDEHSDKFYPRDPDKFNDNPDWDDILPMKIETSNSGLKYRSVFGPFHPDNFPKDYKPE